MTSNQRFVSLGLGHIVCTNNIWAVTGVSSAQDRRILASAKTEQRYVDWTGHRPTKSLVLLDNGLVIGCLFRPQTMFNRLRLVTEYEMMNDPKFEDEPDPEEDEDVED